MMAIRTLQARDVALAKHALIQRFTELGGQIMGGYTPRLGDNLFPGIPADALHDFAESGNYEQLTTRMRAIYSPAALAVNTFGPWRADPKPLPLAALTGFLDMTFARRCPSDLGGIPPCLDVVLTGPQGEVVAVESRFLEHLEPVEPAYSAGFSRIRDQRSQTGWFRELQELTANPLKYVYLDAAHLIRHFLGLSYLFPARPVVIVYLYWEPSNWQAYDVYRQHREELKAFTRAVAGAGTFHAISYPALWTKWQASASMQPYEAHITRLQQRYGVEV